MTEQNLRRLIVTTAESYLGVKRSNKTHKPIIDIYNSVSPLPRGYKMTLKDDWCAAYVSAIAIKVGLNDIIPQECSCNQQIALWQQMGRWQEADDYKPSIGDVIYYDWQDSTDYADTDNTNLSDHVGYVASIDRDNIKVIEGNKSTQSVCGYRLLKVNGRYIRGYGLPDYASKALTMEDYESDDEAIAIQLPILYKSVKGYEPSVKALQSLLNAYGFSCGMVDGSFGVKTQYALKSYQTANKLTVDGFCGKQSWTKLLKG